MYGGMRVKIGQVPSTPSLDQRRQGSEKVSTLSMSKSVAHLKSSILHAQASAIVALHLHLV